MTDPPVGDRGELTYRALADPRRRHLLRLLEDASGPLDVGTLSGRVGLHPNTVREHLDLLRHAGLVTRAAEKRTQPGRPRTLYAAAPGKDRSPGVESYRFLAEVLASYMEARLDDPAGAAQEAGRVWGHHLVDRPAPFEHLDASQVVTQLINTLADFGFAPEEAVEEGCTLIKLHDCPFREMARSRGHVVCAVHLGILRGMAEELGGSVSIEDLRPFVEPSLCIASLSRTSRPESKS